MQSLHDFVSQYSILISGLILLITYIFIIIDKIPKVTVAILGACATVLFGLVSQHKGHEAINPHYFINFVDFNVIFLLVSMMIIVHISSKSGIFDWLAIELLKLTKGYPILILIVLAVFTAVVSAFLDNVTTVILVLPVTFIIAKELSIDPVPLLITEIISSNIGGTATLIGDPPNIIIGSKAGFSFMTFVNELTGIVFLILIVSTGILILFFRKNLTTTKEEMKKISNLNNSNTITDRKLMLRSIFTILFVTIGFVTHDITHIETYLVAAIGAGFLLIFEKPEEILPQVEWNTIFFFIGLFTIIGGFEASGGIKLISQWLLDITRGSDSATAMIILWGSGILSGFIDNIPYTATMAPLIHNIELIEGVKYAYPLWWCLSLGACLGGNMTIIGAAANVIVSETSVAHGHKISFMKFLKYGVIITFISLIISSIYIYYRFLVNA